MPYELRRRGKKWGVWNAGSKRWMAEKPLSLKAAQGQIAAVQASEHSDWEGSGEKGRTYKKTAFRKKKTRKVYRRVEG